jgi:homoserine dehydrogenase
VVKPKNKNMSTHKQLTLGLFGFGVVGEGLYKILKQTPSLNARIKRIVIKHPDKKRNAPGEIFTQLANEVLNDDSINVIVELIDDADAAYYIVTEALKKGKAVVSANKKLIAEHLEELLALQKKHNVPFLYEASTCASIPVIRNLEEYYDNDLLHSVSGIVNGSTNFILSKIFNEGLEFVEALLQAQQLGFAESNPSLDVLGIDAVNKLTILLVHAYGIVTKPTSILFNGIQNIQVQDAKVANEKEFKIKLVAKAAKLKNGKIAAYLLPQFVTADTQLYNVENEYNGVVIESGFSDKQFFYGKGAGSFPTASAVLSDISALRYNYKYEYKKKYQSVENKLSNEYYLKVYVSYDNLKSVQKDAFEWIEEFHSGQQRSYFVGVIHAEKLLKDDWWKQHGVSLILTPEPIIENIDYRDVQKRSLELAGVL